MITKILVAICLTMIVGITVRYIIKQRRKAILRRKVLMDGSDDYNSIARNITNSISKSRSLYKELISQVHPDRYVDESKLIATELSSRITNAKRNYDELLKLKVEVGNFLEGNKNK